MMNLGRVPRSAISTRRSRFICSTSSGDWYGEAVSIEFVRRLRDTMRFDGLDALVAQLGRDADSARVSR